MSLLVARIVMRYIAGLLVGYGLLGHGDVALIVADPELEREIALVIGGAAAALVEIVYTFARRRGWAT